MAKCPTPDFFNNICLWDLTDTTKPTMKKLFFILFSFLFLVSSCGPSEQEAQRMDDSLANALLFQQEQQAMRKEQLYCERDKNDIF